MDQHLAAETPKHWERGLADALYRQLSHQISTTPSSSDAALAASLPDPVRQPDL
jgi:Rod binding domain-containing protein